MRHKKKAVAIAGIVMATVALAGCSGSDSTVDDGTFPTFEVPEPTPTATPTPEATPSSETVAQPSEQDLIPQSKVLEGFDLPEKTVKVGETFTIDFDPAWFNEDAGFVVVNDDISIVDVSPESSPMDGKLTLVAKKPGTTRVGLAKAEPGSGDVTKTADFIGNTVTVVE